MISRRSTLSTLTVAVIGVLAALLVPVAPAQASSTILCKGFAACNKAGMSHHQYKANYQKMWWRMYAGHNCTNYVAYRMVRNGMSETRPWSGSGDARNWGVALKQHVNQTPTVGSVAWWSSNHVAYVEQVVDANTIIVSEDHWKGDFDWRRIVRAGGGWPTGFIHLADEAVTSTSPPAVTGPPQVGARLSASAGGWTVSKPVFEYQWLANGAAISGATASTFTPTASQLKATLAVRVTARSGTLRPGVATSAATGAVKRGQFAAGSPRLTGPGTVGSVLTLETGTWTPAMTGTSVQWQANGVAIPGAGGTSLSLDAKQLGQRITAVVTGRRAGYKTVTVTTPSTGRVAPGHLEPTKPASLTRRTQVGQRLKVNAGVTAPQASAVSYRWLRDGKPIKGATKPGYKLTAADAGHLIQVRVRQQRNGYVDLVQRVATTEPVRGMVKATITSPAKPRGSGKHSIQVVMRSNLGKRPGGKVVLIDATGARHVKTLKAGKVTFSGSWLKRGKQKLKVEYAGNKLLGPRTFVRTVAVR